ncbi:cytochrome b/b6 domain-containing protein [Roseibium sp. FZY0029]|uniref:cytochrome b/b6 domain-containing protein n=1 Tax=Roseibium sp. FZY0029 TaxID=3116647 RepID=UPI002E9C751F|nr:cytochrome b/b6 domain-containing protein [Roseibium sp. FZY0029]
MMSSPTSSIRLLHWTIAGLTIGALVTGFTLTNTDPFSPYLLKTHLALGLSAGVLALVRTILWLTKGAPASVVAFQSALQQALGKSVHAALRLVPLLLLISGIGMIVISGSLETIANGTFPGLEAFVGLPPAGLHHAAALLLAALIGLHSLAALWHWQRGFYPGRQ